MAENSEIEWLTYTRADGRVVEGATFNPWRGCVAVSEACRHCYAETLSKRNPAVLGEWGKDAKRVLAAESYWKAPLHWNRAAEKSGERRRVFCASLADVFEDRPDLEAPRLRLLDLIRQTPHLDWLLLTKRPQNIKRHLGIALEMAVFGDASQETCDWLGQWSEHNFAPSNVWLGTTIEQQRYVEPRLGALLSVAAQVHFVSAEPLFEELDLTGWLGTDKEDGDGYLWDGVTWVICGGESGPGARPMNPEWARSLKAQCQDAGVPFFFKQYGEWAPYEALGADEWRYAKSKGDVRYGQVRRDGVPLFDDRLFETRYPFAHSCGSHVSIGPCLVKAGKKLAGRVLDGRTWDESPTVVTEEVLA